MSIPTELRMRLLVALARDRGETCLQITGAIRDHALDPASKARSLQRMRDERPDIRSVWKFGRAQGDLAAKIVMASTSKKISDEELVAAVGELIQGDHLGQSAIERICADVLRD